MLCDTAFRDYTKQGEPVSTNSRPTSANTNGGSVDGGGDSSCMEIRRHVTHSGRLDSVDSADTGQGG